MLRRIGTSLAFLTMLGSFAQAEPAIIRQDVEVHFGDLNISSEEGAQVLFARIDSAAKEACGGAPNFSSLYATAPALVEKEYAACHADAIGRAVASLNAPQVTKIYARSGEATLQRVAGR